MARTPETLVTAETVASVSAPEATAAQEATRRTFQAYLAGSLSAFVSVVLGLPIVGYLAAPLASIVRARWVSLGRADAFEPGAPKLVSLSLESKDGWRQITESRAVWVLAAAGRQFSAFNGRCTHLGCAYSWKTDGEYAGKFFCPCHDGVYDAKGAVLAGPPPRPLDQLEVKVDGGELLVLYQDYRLGTPQKEGV